VISQKRCNEIGGIYSAGTVFRALPEEFCEFMWARYRRQGLKIEVFVFSLLFVAHQFNRVFRGELREICDLTARSLGG
jgi:hypothetical protein